MKRFRLSPLDHIFANLLGVYMFDSVLEVDRLQKSLDDTINNHLPVLSSKIEENERNEYFLRLVQPSNVQIVEKKIESPENPHDLYLPDPQSGNLDFKEGSTFHSWCENIELSKVWGKPKLGVEILKVTLLQRKQKKSIIIVSMNHCIADAYSLALFMNCWSRGEERLKKKYELNRDFLHPTPNYEIDEIVKRPAAQMLQEIYRSDMHSVPKEEQGFRICPRSEYVEKLIHFDPTSIEKLKEEANPKNQNSSKENTRLSTNDCISAFMWKFHAILYQKEVKSGIIPLKVVINIRSKFSRIDDTYFGNALTVPNLDQPASKILDSTIGDLALQIRKDLIQKVDEEVCQTTIDFVDYIMTRKEGRKDYSRVNTIWMNDWRIVEDWKPKFEGVKCERAILNPPKGENCHPQLVTVMKPSFKKGLFVRIYIPIKVEKKLEGLDLADISTLEKMRKMF